METAGWIALTGGMTLVLLVGGGLLRALWVVFQSQIGNIKTQIDAVAARVTAIEDDAVHSGEHREFAKRLDEHISILRNQVNTIETTRPTTGELQAIGSGNKDQITKLEDRVGKLENMRG